MYEQIRRICAGTLTASRSLLEELKTVPDTDRQLPINLFAADFLVFFVFSLLVAFLGELCGLSISDPGMLMKALQQAISISLFGTLLAIGMLSFMCHLIICVYRASQVDRCCVETARRKVYTLPVTVAGLHVGAVAIGASLGLLVYAIPFYEVTYSPQFISNIRVSLVIVALFWGASFFFHRSVFSEDPDERKGYIVLFVISFLFLFYLYPNEDEGKYSVWAVAFCFLLLIFYFAKVQQRH